MEIIEATAVTDKDAAISGKMPKAGGSSVGYQYFPKMKSLTETLLKMGRPSINRKITIRPSIVIDANAIQKKKMRIARSLLRRLFPILPPFSTLFPFFL
jgi:hypothetical protein